MKLTADELIADVFGLKQRTHMFTISEVDRQLDVLAVAKLAIERPGWQLECILPILRKYRRSSCLE